MGNVVQFLLRHFVGDEPRQHAMAFERARDAASAEAPQMSLAEIKRELAGTDPVPMYELADGSVLQVDRRIRRQHTCDFGSTGMGKSMNVASALLDEFDRACASLERSPERDDEVVPVEFRVVDVKSDTAILLKKGIASRFLRASSRIRRAIARSCHAIEWREDAITPVPLLSDTGTSAEYEAELKADIITRTSRQEWPETVRFLLFQLLRVARAVKVQPHPKWMSRVLRDAAARREIVSHIRALDLRDFLDRLETTVRPQTIEAFERRIAIEFSFPAVHDSTFIPYDDIVRLGVPLNAPIILADCGSSQIPPSIGIARANVLLTDIFFGALRRDATIPLTVFIEEALLLLANAPGLLQRVLDAIRVLRARNTALKLAAQSVDTFPRAAMRELVTNLGSITAFQSRGDVAEILAPHVSLPPGVPPRRGREAFERDLSSLKPRDAYFWVKGVPAIRVRSRFLVDPAKESGVPSDELLDIFDREITPRSRIPVDTARKLIEDWEARTFGPQRPAARSGGENLRSFLGLDEGDDE